MKQDKEPAIFDFKKQFERFAGKTTSYVVGEGRRSISVKTTQDTSSPFGRKTISVTEKDLQWEGLTTVGNIETLTIDDTGNFPDFPFPTEAERQQKLRRILNLLQTVDAIDGVASAPIRESRRVHFVSPVAFNPRRK